MLFISVPLFAIHLPNAAPSLFAFPDSLSGTHAAAAGSERLLFDRLNEGIIMSWCLLTQVLAWLPWE